MENRQRQNLYLKSKKGSSHNPFVKKKEENLPNNIFWMKRNLQADKQ